MQPFEFTHSVLAYKNKYISTYANYEKHKIPIKHFTLSSWNTVIVCLISSLPPVPSSAVARQTSNFVCGLEPNHANAW